MRIGFFSICHFMHKGGAERVISTMANSFVNAGNEVVVFHGEKKRSAPVYPLDPRISTCELTLQPANLEAEKELCEQKKLDVFYVPFMIDSCIKILKLLQGINVPLIFSEHTDPNYSKQCCKDQGLRDFCFSYADAVHFLCNDYIKSVSEKNREKVFIIPNSPFWEESEEVSCTEEKTFNVILTMARLQEFPKQISLLIKAFQRLADRYPDWKCVICGDGVDRNAYEKMISAYGLQNRVILAGTVDDVQRYYRSSSIFCLPSLYEGLPCAMIEAQSCGLPGVGFARCAGVKEIIKDGENGLLADSFTPESLSVCLDRLMGDRDLRQRMRRRSLDLAQRYSKDHVVAQWHALFDYAAAKKGHTALDIASDVEFPAVKNNIESGTPFAAQLLRVSHRLAQEVARLERKGA